MARAPFQILVLPWRRTVAGSVEFALVCRADDGAWQGIAGGGEMAETPLAAAIRESLEEAAIPPSCTFLPLDATASIPANLFAEGVRWGDTVYVIPEHAFGVDVSDLSIHIGHEHTAMRWLSFAQACALVRYDSNRVALWELNQRIHGLGPRQVVG